MRLRERSYPLWLVLGGLAALPLLVLAVLLAYDTWRQYQNGVAEAYRTAELLRTLAASKMEQSLLRAEMVLDQLAAQAPVRALDPGRCDPMLHSLQQADAGYAALYTLDRHGQPVCGTPSPPPNQVALAHRRAAMARIWSGAGATVSHPARDPRSGRWTLSLMAPLRAPGGAIAGIVGLELVLLEDRPLAIMHGMPAHTVIGIVDGAGRIVARSEQAARRVGQRLSPANAAIVLGQRRGTFRSTDYAGRARLFAFAPLAKTDWILFVGLDEGVVLAPLGKLAAQRALLLLLLLLGMGVLTALVALRIALPVRRILATMARVGAGQRQQRAALHGPRELRQIARQLNTMLDALAQARHTARQSEERFRVAFLTSPNALLITTLDEGRVLEVNDSFSTIFGWSASEVLGRTTSELRLWHNPAVRLQLLQALRQDGACLALEGEFVRRDGSVCTGQLSAHQISLDGQACILSIIMDISARKASEAHIYHLSYTDPLTQLPNRRLLLDRLAHAQAQGARQGRLGCLVYIDLDNFKAINESAGIPTGDHLLCEVAVRLGQCLRQGDTVARLGGDDFMLLLEDLGEAGEAAPAALETRCADIAAALRAPYQLDGHAYHCTASMGITLFGPAPEEPLELLKRAELALYQAKAAGRDTRCFFDPQMQAAVSARVALEHDLRDAITGGQLQLYYQAQLDGERVVGVEALVRWPHPQRGMISPADFIPLAEQSGLILALGNWVLRNACQQIAQWQAQPGLHALTVAVNVSPRQIGQPAFAAEVQETLRQSGAEAARLKLELTENLLLNNVEDVIGKMQALRRMGVGFALDDFGTGYSSLSYLKRLPLDQLKIDQGFVRDILHNANDLAIARMVIALAHSMGLEVLAEGVETSAQRDMLQALGCHRFQGYLFSRPLPAAEFERYFHACNSCAPA